MVLGPAFSERHRHNPVNAPTTAQNWMHRARPQWRKFAAEIVGRPGVLIPDTDDDLNWHAFLGHSIDMQGFRAAEFSGADPVTRSAPGFASLKARGVGVRELALLWAVPAIRDHLMVVTSRPRGPKGPLSTTLSGLRAHGGLMFKDRCQRRSCPGT